MPKLTFLFQKRKVEFQDLSFKNKKGIEQKCPTPFIPEI